MRHGAALRVIIAVIAVLNWSHPASPYLVTGALLYTVGTFLVTVVFNVPLTDALAAAPAGQRRDCKSVDALSVGLDRLEPRAHGGIHRRAGLFYAGASRAFSSEAGCLGSPQN